MEEKGKIIAMLNSTDKESFILGANLAINQGVNWCKDRFRVRTNLYVTRDDMIMYKDGWYLVGYHHNGRLVPGSPFISKRLMGVCFSVFDENGEIDEKHSRL